MLSLSKSLDESRADITLICFNKDEPSVGRYTMKQLQKIQMVFLFVKFLDSKVESNVDGVPTERYISVKMVLY